MKGNLQPVRSLCQQRDKRIDSATAKPGGIAEIITVPGYINVDFEGHVNFGNEKTSGYASSVLRSLLWAENASASRNRRCTGDSRCIGRQRGIRGARHYSFSTSTTRQVRSEITMDEAAEIIVNIFLCRESSDASTTNLIRGSRCSWGQDQRNQRTTPSPAGFGSGLTRTEKDQGNAVRQSEMGMKSSPISVSLQAIRYKIIDFTTLDETSVHEILPRQTQSARTKNHRDFIQEGIQIRKKIYLHHHCLPNSKPPMRSKAWEKSLRITKIPRHLQEYQAGSADAFLRRAVFPRIFIEEDWDTAGQQFLHDKCD